METVRPWTPVGRQYLWKTICVREIRSQHLGPITTLALCLPLLLAVQCATMAPTAVSTDDGQRVDRRAWDRLVARDPLAFLIACRDHYLETVTDYRCVFRKQERIDGAVQPEEHIRIRFRECPYSVDMRWFKNTRRAARLTYVKGRWTTGDKELAHIQPSGVLGLLAPMGVKRDIHGPALARESRRPVDQFGYRNTLERIIGFCRQASEHPDYDLRFDTTTSFHGRPCYHLERRLPYDGESVGYPNRLLDIYIDREWLVPLGSLAYADDERETLLGSYLLIEPEFNVGLSDEDFP